MVYTMDTQYKAIYTDNIYIYITYYIIYIYIIEQDI